MCHAFRLSFQLHFRKQGAGSAVVKGKLRNLPQSFVFRVVDVKNAHVPWCKWKTAQFIESVTQRQSKRYAF